MKAKLIKKGEHYFLEVEPYTLSNLQRHTIIANTFDKPKGHILQLSLKNCQAIERGYDLEELAENCADQYADRFDYNDGNGNREVYANRDEIEKVYTIAFQKALELMGDKKFSEEDIRKAYNQGEEDCYKSGAVSAKRNKYIQSLQQTEWDVKIEMEVVPDFGSRPDIDGQLFTTNKKIIPLLDTNGCLILKRI